MRPVHTLLFFIEGESNRAVPRNQSLASIMISAHKSNDFSRAGKVHLGKPAAACRLWPGSSTGSGAVPANFHFVPCYGNEDLLSTSYLTMVLKAGLEPWCRVVRLNADMQSAGSWRFEAEA